MNVPGRADGNWRWRCTKDMMSESAFEWLRDLTKDSSRLVGSTECELERMLEVNVTRLKAMVFPG